MNIYSKHRNSHSVGWSTWHFEWCTKYRHKLFNKSYLKNLCKIILLDIAESRHFEIIDLEVDIDHVHIVISIPLTMSPIEVLHQLKGKSSRILFILIPELENIYWNRPGLRSLWSSGKFVASVGHITIEKAKQYLEAHHAKFFFENLRVSTRGGFKFNI
jgi:REP-associated tyrosine transposase